jgi:RNA polymerase sigma-70 factor (TIGR02943 family)
VKEQLDNQVYLADWVRQYADEMYSWALYKTSVQEIAQDLVQDTFMAAVEGYRRFEGKSNPKTWLFAILNNKIKDHYRRNLRRAITSSQDGTSILDQLFDQYGGWKEERKPQKWSESQVDLLDDQEFRQVFQHCIKKLPEIWNNVIQYKYLEEKDGKIICQELQISSSNYWQILHRAKLQLRECLEKAWFNK